MYAKARPMAISESVRVQFYIPHRFRDLFLALYDQFLDERLDATSWNEVQRTIHAWLPTRTGKA